MSKVVQGAGTGSDREAVVICPATVFFSAAARPEQQSLLQIEGPLWAEQVGSFVVCGTGGSLHRGLSTF